MYLSDTWLTIFTALIFKIKTSGDYKLLIFGYYSLYLIVNSVCKKIKELILYLKDIFVWHQKLILLTHFFIGREYLLNRNIWPFFTRALCATFHPQHWMHMFFVCLFVCLFVCCCCCCCFGKTLFLEKLLRKERTWHIISFLKKIFYN